MISLYDILEFANGQLFGEPAAQIFTDFCLDPAQAGPNLLFVTLKNDWGDTYRYMEEVIKQGVSGILCMRAPECDTSGVSVILVRDTTIALMMWAQQILAKVGAKTIAVSGSSGKSTTVTAITHVLETRYRVLGSDPNLIDNRLSVPLSLAKLKPEHQFVVMRFGTTQPGEMAAMLQATQPQVGAVLTVDHTHTDYFQSIEQVAAEKKQLLEYLSPNGLAILNYDDDRVRSLNSDLRTRVATIGVESFGANLMAYNVVVKPEGTGFDLRYGGERYVGRWIPLLGKHQLYSVLAALSVGIHYGISIEDGLRALTRLAPLAGRMNPLSGINDSILIDDTHSATPQATLAALDWLARVRDPHQRVIFILGDMDHLGTQSQVEHRMIGQRVAEIADVLLTEGAEAAAAGRAALDAGMDNRSIYTTYSTQDIVSALLNRYHLTSDDIVLVKGGASMRMERVVAALMKDTRDTSKLVRQDLPDRVDDLFQPARPSWIEIDTQIIAHNTRAIKDWIGDQVMLMAVVKADAYGHGAVIASQTALLNGAEYLAVANVQEAIELRDAGIIAPILILSYTPAYLVRQMIRQDLTVTMYDLDMARAYDRAAREIGGKLRVHVKIDTGLGRLGVMPNDTLMLFRHLYTLKHIEIEGIYTHFSSADSDPDYTAEQVNVFKNVVRPLRAGGFNFKYVHAANSAGTLTAQENHFNMVRVGAALYGLHPSSLVRLPKQFRSALTWKTVIAQVKTLPPDHAVGYGNTYYTQQEERVAIIPVGYADGYRRSPNWGVALIHGKRAPIVGRVSMEKTILNVTHIPDVSIGDEVVLLGRQGDDEITADEIAARLGTINYEVVCDILPRVPRR